MGRWFESIWPDCAFLGAVPAREVEAPSIGLPRPSDLLGVGEAVDVAHLRGEVGGIDQGDARDGQEIDSRGLNEELGHPSFLFFDLRVLHFQDR